MAGDVVFCGDPHGRVREISGRLSSDPPEALVFLGDMGLSAPLHVECAPLLEAGVRVLWIHGNHDTQTTPDHDFLFCSELKDDSISGKVVEAGGLRIAGLGGVFREKVWYPRPAGAEPVFRTRDEMLEALPRHSHWRRGIPLKHRSSIFPEDVETLASQQADVLIVHEAPSYHRYGFPVIDDLARQMGVKVIVHGHHHRSARLAGPSFTVVGLALAETVSAAEICLQPSSAPQP
jgi:predicted phosphodiesterase